MKIPIFLLCFQAFQTTNNKRDRSFKSNLYLNSGRFYLSASRCHYMYININASRFAVIVLMCEISTKCVSLLTQQK